MQSLFACEIRDLKGVPFVVPVNADYLLRVRFAAGSLPGRFLSLRAVVALRAQAVEVTAAGANEDGVTPPEGFPERLVGIVLERMAAGRILLEAAGVPFEVDLPGDMDPPRLGERIACTLTDPPEVVALEVGG